MELLDFNSLSGRIEAGQSNVKFKLTNSATATNYALLQGHNPHRFNLIDFLFTPATSIEDLDLNNISRIDFYGKIVDPGQFYSQFSPIDPATSNLSIATVFDHDWEETKFSLMSPLTTTVALFNERLKSHAAKLANTTFKGWRQCPMVIFGVKNSKYFIRLPPGTCLYTTNRQFWDILAIRIKDAPLTNNHVHRINHKNVDYFICANDSHETIFHEGELIPPMLQSGTVQAWVDHYYKIAQIDPEFAKNDKGNGSGYAIRFNFFPQRARLITSQRISPGETMTAEKLISYLNKCKDALFIKWTLPRSILRFKQSPDNPNKIIGIADETYSKIKLCMDMSIVIHPSTNKSIPKFNLIPTRSVINRHQDIFPVFYSTLDATNVSLFSLEGTFPSKNDQVNESQDMNRFKDPLAIILLNVDPSLNTPSRVGDNLYYIIGYIRQEGSFRMAKPFKIPFQHSSIEVALLSLKTKSLYKFSEATNVLMLLQTE